MGRIRDLARGVVECGRSVVGKVCGLVGAGVAVVGTSAMAADTTIPAMPVDFGDVASQGATVLGTVVGGVIGIFVVVALVNMGIKWTRRAFTS